MRADRTLWEPGSAGRMEAEGLPAVVADEGDPPGRLRRHSPDKSGSHNRWGGSAGRLAADWTLWEPGSAGRMGPDLVLWEPGSAGRMEAEGLPAVVADEGDPPGRLRRHSPDKSGSHNRWGGSAGRLAADWTLWEARPGFVGGRLCRANGARPGFVGGRLCRANGGPTWFCGSQAPPGEWRRRRPGGVASVGACRQEPFGLHSLGEPELPQGALRSPFARGTRAPTGCPATNRAGLPGQARPGCQGARCPV